MNIIITVDIQYSCPIIFKHVLALIFQSSIVVLRLRQWIVVAVHNLKTGVTAQIVVG